ncbi:MAG TPA: PHB depolymerase family esterase [Pyrinomonadaceae bacterium]|nr:PHB depolymerase family esterase [Pyrinomonadaceae bacterium]
MFTNKKTNKGSGIVSAEDGEAAANGRLLARPSRVDQAASAGRQTLRLDETRGGLLYVPAGYRHERPAPLVLMLHGAGGDAEQSLGLTQQYADEFGFVVLAPYSRRATWDVIGGRYGADVSFIDRALEQTFSLCAVNPHRIAIGGFSDGASYALSLGVMNGDLFTHVIAFSPGFMTPLSREGNPRIFISHGTRDRVLPIERCSRRIVQQVESAGYELSYREFDGAHNVPPQIAREGFDWFVSPHG